MLKNDYPCIFVKISRKTAISSLLVAHRDGFESSFANMEPLLNWKDPRLCIASWPDETLRVSHAVQYRDQASLARSSLEKMGKKKKIPANMRDIYSHSSRLFLFGCNKIILKLLQNFRKAKKVTCYGMTKVTYRALWEGETLWMPQRQSSHLQIPQARA